MNIGELKYNTASIVEITSSHIGVLMDGHKLFNIAISESDTASTIKQYILDHALEGPNPQNVIPFNTIEDIPVEIRSKLHSTIDLQDLKKEVLSELDFQPTLDCNDIREEMYPGYHELLNALYEKDVNQNSQYYDSIMERIKVVNELFPKDLGEVITIEKYEEIINGL